MKTRSGNSPNAIWPAEIPQKSVWNVPTPKDKGRRLVIAWATLRSLRIPVKNTHSLGRSKKNWPGRKKQTPRPRWPYVKTDPADIPPGDYRDQEHPHKDAGKCPSGENPNNARKNTPVCLHHPEIHADRLQKGTMRSMCASTNQPRYWYRILNLIPTPTKMAPNLQPRKTKPQKGAHQYPAESREGAPQ